MRRSSNRSPRRLTAKPCQRKSRNRPKLPKRLKKDSDADYEKKLEKYRELGHDMCVFNSAQLAFVAKQRDLLLDLVLDYHAEKRACNMAEFSDFTIAAFSLSPDSRPSERPTANAIRMCSSTNTKTRPPRRRHC